ncbi:MAG: serine/threonine protein kinase, partial [Candidatus Obscuribacterales bacterium]|nr:serine/threonine protein kinase [Steroidobacteraceae bacterium]
MKTQDARWLRIRDLFEQAIELAPEQRDAFLDARCGDDPNLRVELKSLLASDAGHTRGPLTGAIGAAVDATTTDRRQELVGTVIGPYRLSSVLGHGGAGTVYLGERVDRQYSAQVAIKVVEGAALHSEIGRRFRAERQILANLNHANIARLIDAGETPQGYPYLVMEYVHGEAIDQYCDRMHLNVEARCELMLRVCSAVQYAHQNLVVHRDIKPANILVTPDGTPKLLDFGIAKLLDTDAAAAELALTRMNDRVLTPEYASPEQILGQPVTTASDVYALGVVLYELLTGLRPYKVSSASQLELERTICVIEPARPSTAIRQAAAKRPLTQTTTGSPPTRDIYAIAEARRTAPQRLVARLGGDLDAILLRALRKEPIYRYPSVEQFTADLRRHLAREPVLARQGNWVYYAQRFSRRHAVAVSATAGFILLLASAVIVTSVQAKRIAVERDNANLEKQTSEAVANFMVNVFAAADPYVIQNKDVTAGELLDKSTQSIRDDLSQQPAVKARLLE